MLILSRKKSESIMIGDDVRIVVTQLDDYRVRIGIEAPLEVPVHRKEIYDKIKAGELQNKTGGDKQDKSYLGWKSGSSAEPARLGG